LLLAISRTEKPLAVCTIYDSVPGLGPAEQTALAMYNEIILHGPIQTSYNVSHWPTIFVLDYKGVIRYFDVRGRELDDAIDKLLEEVAKEGS
jgi:hypothetical protein